MIRLALTFCEVMLCLIAIDVAQNDHPNWAFWIAYAAVMLAYSEGRFGWGA